MNKKDSNLINQDLIKNYSNFSAEHFAKKYGVSKTAIYSRASKLKLSSSNTWELHKDIIIKDYVGGKTLDYLGAKYGHYEQNIKKKLETWGIKLRNPSELNTIYSFDKTFFKKIDSAEKAYWLGFIYADGNVYKKGETYVLQIALSKKDSEHVLKFRKSIKSNHKLYKDREAIRIMIHNKELGENLKKLGVFERKSLLLKFPTKNILPEKFISSFILGYFDGDGSISYQNKRWGFNLIGPTNFLFAISKILTKKGLTKTKLSKEKRCLSGKISYLSYGGTIIRKKDFSNKNLEKIYNFLYSKNQIYLERKKRIFMKILSKRRLYDRA